VRGRELHHPAVSSGLRFLKKFIAITIAIENLSQIDRTLIFIFQSNPD